MTTRHVASIVSPRGKPVANVVIVSLSPLLFSLSSSLSFSLFPLIVSFFWRLRPHFSSLGQRWSLGLNVQDRDPDQGRDQALRERDHPSEIDTLRIRDRDRYLITQYIVGVEHSWP